jgi:hypothetical protein
VTVTKENYYWDGGMEVNGSATKNTFTTAEGTWYQTGFDDTPDCYDLFYSAYSTWVGLGGYNSGRIIQAGTDVGPDTVNEIFPWAELEWDAAVASHVIGPFTLGSNYSILPGDQVDSYITFSPGSPGNFGVSVYDYTNGRVFPYSGNYYYDQTAGVNRPASAYYDGTTTEYTTEAPVGRGHLWPDGKVRYYLRKAHLNNTKWTYAVANGVGVAQFPSWKMIQFDGVSDPAHPTPQDTSWDGWHAWYNYWTACT